MDLGNNRNQVVLPVGITRHFLGSISPH